MCGCPPRWPGRSEAGRRSSRRARWLQPFGSSKKSEVGGGGGGAGRSRPRDSHLFDAAGLATRQVDAELLGGAEDVFLRVAHLDGRAVLRQHLHVEAER